MELFPQTTSGALNAGHKRGRGVTSYDGGGGIVERNYGNDSGSAARFFYCAKASRKEREMGCEGMEETTFQSGCGGDMPVDDEGKDRDRFKVKTRNHHPTVKPLALMRYLCRLVTPPAGTILDPFMGSGTTGIAAKQEDFNFTGIDISQEYCDIAGNRIKTAKSERLIELVRNA
jgi:site-specific DNA-methyltransferase (adenine-specific)